MEPITFEQLQDIAIFVNATKISNDQYHYIRVKKELMDREKATNQKMVAYTLSEDWLEVLAQIDRYTDSNGNTHYIYFFSSEVYNEALL